MIGNLFTVIVMIRHALVHHVFSNRQSEQWSNDCTPQRGNRPLRLQRKVKQMTLNQLHGSFTPCHSRVHRPVCHQSQIILMVVREVSLWTLNKSTKKNRKRVFVDAWKSEFQWVRCVNQVMFCSLCRELPALSDTTCTFVKGIQGDKRHETLVFHATSTAHLKYVKRKQLETDGPGAGRWKNMSANSWPTCPKRKKRLSAKFNTAFYVAKKKVAFKQFSDLCTLQEKMALTWERFIATTMHVRTL